MTNKPIKCFTVQCAECLRVLGISIKNFQKEVILCMKCARDIDFDKWKPNKPWKMEVVNETKFSK